jgi:hypothetical protein
VIMDSAVCHGGAGYTLELKVGFESINPDKSNAQLDHTQMKRVHAKVALRPPLF